MSEMAGEGPRVLGSLRAADGKGTVRIEDSFPTGIDELWSAITDPRRLAKWHAQVDGDLRPGGEFRIYVAADDWEGSGRVQLCEPPRRFTVMTRESDESWRKGQGEAPFDEIVEVTLKADGQATVLVIVVGGIPLDKVAFYGVGWQIHAEALAAYLSGREPGGGEARWDELLPAYQQLAADIGRK
ncbi:MAG: SRPBCC domain-containing protein [Candidatus Dormibacteria bacterium]